MEKEFDEFLSQEIYDMAEEAIFRLVRTAFIAGWRAAGGEMEGDDTPSGGEKEE
jgi:hypothetical protein